VRDGQLHLEPLPLFPHSSQLALYDISLRPQPVMRHFEFRHNLCLALAFGVRVAQTQLRLAHAPGQILVFGG